MKTSDTCALDRVDVSFYKVSLGFLSVVVISIFRIRKADLNSRSTANIHCRLVVHKSKVMWRWDDRPGLVVGRRRFFFVTIFLDPMADGPSPPNFPTLIELVIHLPPNVPLSSHPLDISDLPSEITSFASRKGDAGRRDTYARKRWIAECRLYEFIHRVTGIPKILGFSGGL